MKQPSRYSLAALCALVVSLTFGTAFAGGAPSGSLASFEGRTIDLRKGWGDAHACAVTASGTTCFRTEAELDSYLGSIVTVAAICSSPLKLYDGTSYGGNILSLSTQATTISLANYGFDNVTSSYKIGPCAARLYAGLGTNLYPGDTSAYAQAATMLSGWTNTISSVYIT